MTASPRIADLLDCGNVREIARVTGRRHSVSGIVVHGAGRGKKLNFPTANLGHEPAGQALPKDGIYAGWATVRGETFGAAISVGYNPTFGEGKHSVEAHLLNFDDDIYDEPIALMFVERIRDEAKFQSVSDLIAQIGNDVARCAAILESESFINQQLSTKRKTHHVDYNSRPENGDGQVCHPRKRHRKPGSPSSAAHPAH
jgi:riboflavin kinase/FMN adenylyltransferase